MISVVCTLAVEQNPGIRCVIDLEIDDHGRNVWRRRPFPRGGLLLLPVNSGVWEWSAASILWLLDRAKNPKFSALLFEVPADFLWVTKPSLEGDARAEKYKPLIYEIRSLGEAI